MKALTFNTVTFDTITKDNQLWIKSSDLAKALGYVDETSVTKIFSRNKDEFTSCMTQTVKLTVTADLKASSRIFSLRGCHLLAMFSRTAVAKEFRKWVLDILDKETGTQQPPQGNSYLPQIMAKASNTACTIAGHIASEMAKQVHNINFTHRFLVAVDNGGVTIRNIDGCNLVNIDYVRKVRRDLRTFNKSMQEMLHRTRILEGEISPKDMDLPLVCSV